MALRLKMLADLVLHSERHIYLSLRKQQELITPLVTKVRGDVSLKKSLAFTAIKSEYLRRFMPSERIFPETTNRRMPLNFTA